MEQLLDKNEQRSLIFLRTLYSEDRWWTEAELSKIGNCSSNTTYRTLGFLKEATYHGYEKFRIVSKKNKGYLLQTTHSLHSIGEIESTFIKETISYKLIHYIFQNENVSTFQLAKALYVSASTVYRKVHHLALYFKSNGLSFNTSTFEISGPEHLIREFFFRFYWYVIKNGEWPFDIITYDDLTHCSNKIRTSLLKLNETEHLQLIYRLSIMTIRYNQCRFLPKRPNMDLIDSPFKTSIDSLIPFFSITIPKKFRVSEYHYLAKILETFPTYQTFHANSLETIDSHKNKQSEAYLFSTSIIRSFKDMNKDIIIENEIDLTYKFIYIYLYVITFSELTIHHSNIHFFLSQTAKDNNSFFTQNRQLVNECAHFFSRVNNFDKDYLLYIFLLIFSSFLEINPLRKTLNVRLICMTEPLGIDYLKQKLISQFDYNFIIYADDLNQTPPNTHFDLILSDTQIEERNEVNRSKTYIWDFPPSERDWKNIYKLINQ